MDLKKEFGGGNNKTIKVTGLERIEQGSRMMKKFRAAKGSGYERGPLVEKFKREISGMRRRKLIEAERPPKSIEQWYERAVNLDRHWRESKREEERLCGRSDVGAQT